MNDTLNAICPLCGATLASSAWVTHHGQRVHPSCWQKTGDAPDSIALQGKYGPGGDYFEAEARLRVRARLEQGGLLDPEAETVSDFLYQDGHK